MGRIVHFEIHADDPERAARFYEAVLGWTSQKWDGPADYWLMTTGDPADRGIDGAVMQRPEPGTPQDGAVANCFVCTAAVQDLDATVAAVIDAGGSIVMQRTEVPGVGVMAYARDTEGNHFGLLQPDPPDA